MKTDQFEGAIVWLALITILLAITIQLGKICDALILIADKL